LKQKKITKRNAFIFLLLHDKQFNKSTLNEITHTKRGFFQFESVLTNILVSFHILRSMPSILCLSPIRTHRKSWISHEKFSIFFSFPITNKNSYIFIMSTKRNVSFCLFW